MKCSAPMSDGGGTNGGDGATPEARQTTEAATLSDSATARNDDSVVAAKLEASLDAAQSAVSAAQ